MNFSSELCLFLLSIMLHGQKKKLIEFFKLTFRALSIRGEVVRVNYVIKQKYTSLRLFSGELSL